MLPTPAELRELSKRLREAVTQARSSEMKQKLAGHAFRLAQVAEQLERDDASVALVRRANIERYERLLADAVDENMRSIVQVPSHEEKAALDKQRRQIRAWRMRAEELRAAADQFTVPSVQESLRRAATTHDQLADRAEALLTGKPPTPGEKAG